MEKIDTAANRELISVIVPIYNAEHKLSLCLSSILCQTYADLEILMIDDGSMDSSVDICREYCRKDARFKLICQENQGIAGARNRGLSMAQGAYVAFVDNDDWIHPQYFEYLHRAINEGDCQLSMVLGVLSQIEDIEKVSQHMPYNIKVLSGEMVMSGLFNKTISSILGSEIPYGVIWARLYKKELLENLSFKDIVEEDVEYSARVLGRVKYAALVPQRMYYWIQYADSVHNNSSPQKVHTRIDSWLSALSEIPVEKEKLRGYGLECLFRKIVSTGDIYDRYATYRPFRDEVRTKIKSIVRAHKSEFMRNRYIPVVNKVVLLVCCYFMPVYSFGRWVINVKTLIKTNILTFND